MASTIQVEIVSAEAEIFSGQAEMVVAPAIMGEVGITPRHSPMLTFLQPGEIRVKHAEGEDAYFVSGGMLEVQPHVITVLSDTAVRAEDASEAAALEAKEAAERALQDANTDVDQARARAELANTMKQLQAIQRLRKKLGR